MEENPIFNIATGGYMTYLSDVYMCPDDGYGRTKAVQIILLPMLWTDDRYSYEIQIQVNRVMYEYIVLHNPSGMVEAYEDTDIDEIMEVFDMFIRTELHYVEGLDYASLYALEHLYERSLGQNRDLIGWLSGLQAVFPEWVD